MNVKGNHPLGELLAAKLFSIETVPAKEQRRMVSRAIKAAVAWHEAEINGPCNQVNSTGTCDHDWKIIPDPRMVVPFERCTKCDERR